MIDFDSLNANLLADARSILPNWFPEGKWRGREFVIGSLSGEAGNSLSINSDTGVWKDFAGDAAGSDLVSLYAAANHIGQAEAARQLGADTKPPNGNSHPAIVKQEPELIVPIPTDTMPEVKGNPTSIWMYPNANDLFICAVARYDPPNAKKIYVPYTHTKDGWIAKMPSIRPLYGLNLLAKSPDKAVLLVGGEKCADYARALPGSPYIGMTWMGGETSWNKSDWSPIFGRKVLIFPDADNTGIKSSKALAKFLLQHCPEVKIIDVSGTPTGWDIADSGFDWKTFKDWAIPRISVVSEPSENGVVKPKTGIKQQENSGVGATDSPAIHHISAADVRLDPAPDIAPLPVESYHSDLVTWHDPVDLFRPVNLPVLRPEWLPQPIADFAFDQAEIIGCDPAILAQSCITVCATSANDGIKLQPNQHNYGWLESARLWSAIVGDPSSKKSPALSRATSHLRKIDIDLFKIEADAKAKFKLDQRIYENSEKKFISEQAKSGLSYGQPIPPEEPQVDRMIVEDTTIEALSEVLKNNPRGVMVMADELAAWLGSMDAYKAKGAGSDRAHWLSAYNGGPRRIDRIARGNILVPNWSASILGGIQPDMMRKVFQNMPEDGLLQRFMPICAKDGTPGSNRIANKKSVSNYNDIIDRLYALPATDNRISFSPEAEEIHNAIVNYYYELKGLEFLPKPLMSFMGKWEGLSPRLMLTFHLIECASANESPSRPIGEATAERVMYYMKEFIFGHALHFYRETLSDSGMTDAIRWIAGYILAHDKADLSNRELLQNCFWWKNAHDREKIAVAQRLIDLSWIAPKNHMKDRFNPLPSAWSVNPKAREIFAAQAKSERDRRVATVEMIRSKIRS